MEDKILYGNEEKTKKESPTRSPFAVWSVGGHDYRLKLSTATVCDLERKVGKNLTLLIANDDIPPLSTMLMLTHAAMSEYNHGISFSQVQRLYDDWINEGYSQVDFLTEVVVPIFKVSGFFTREQMEMLEDESL